MVGIRLIIIMAIVGGLIAYIADKMGSKIGKKRISLFGLRPKHTSILLTVLSGMIISTLTIGVVTISSESARTALFGMEKIQKELKSLNEEKATATQALNEAKEKVDKQNGLILELDKKIEASTQENAQIEQKLSQVNDSYKAAQEQVTSLNEAKTVLTTEIADLEKTTETLRKGIVNMREGQVFYRAGEVIYAAVLHGGQSHQENLDQINWMLANANETALQRLGVKHEEGKTVQAIWIPQQLVDEAVKVMDRTRGNLLFRVRTVANIFVGELAACDLEIHENQFIYPEGTLIHSETYDLKKHPEAKENLILKFLTQVNHKAVENGVVPDPLTGKVGNMDASTMLETNAAINKSGGRFTLNAYAKQDITSAGPVTVRLEVKPVMADE